MPAWAESRLVLAQPVVPETMPVAVQRQTLVHIAEGLVDTGLDVSVDPFPAGACVSGSCLVDMARAHRAVAVVLTEVTAEGRNYRIRMKLVDGRDGRTAGQIDVPCDFCAYDELGQASMRAARQLVLAEQQRRNHRTLPLFQNGPPRQSPLPWIALGAGVALAVTGVILMTMDGCDDENPDGSCRDETNTRWPAALVIGTGALLIGGGGASLLFTVKPSTRGQMLAAGAAVRVAF